MTDGGAGPSDGRGRPWSIPSWRRIGDFLMTVAQLERTYQSLKSSQDQLRSEVKSLQREVDRHSGQLDALMTFVQKALDKGQATQAMTKRSNSSADDC